MKRLFLIWGILMISAGVWGQTEANRSLFLDFSVGSSGINYNLSNGKVRHQPGISFSAGKAFFFNEHWGMAIGVGMSTINAQLNIDTLLKSPLTDKENQLFEFRARFKNWKEEQRIITLDLPVSIKYRLPLSEKYSFMADLGAKVMFPLSAKATGSGDGLLTSGFFSKWNIEFDDVPEQGFGNYTGQKSAKMEMNPVFAINTNMGIVVKLSSKTDLYLGTYFNYGLNNALKKSNKLVTEPIDVYNGFLGSNLVTKANFVTVGVKVGLFLNTEKPKPSAVLVKSRERRSSPALHYIDTVPQLQAQPNEVAKSNETLLQQDSQLISPTATTDKDKATDVSGTGNPKLMPATQQDNEMLMIDEAQQLLRKLENQHGALFGKSIPADKIRLKETSLYLKSHPALLVLIVGYGGDFGTINDNQKAGNKYAQLVKKLLMEMGVPENQLITKGESLDNGVVTKKKSMKRLHKVNFEVLNVPGM